MKKILITPRRYIQGPGVLHELGESIKPLGGKVVLLWDAVVKDLFGETVLASCHETGIETLETLFCGEATLAERERVAGIATEQQATTIVGLGGGKVLDVAKGAANDAKTAMVSCPTIASTDSPTSACSVWYDAEGNYVGFDCWPFNPDLVLVDTRVIAGAPVRTFVAGMGDALATWLEAEAVYKSRSLNFAGGHATLAAMTLASLSFETILEYGRAAKSDVERHLVTPAVEKVVEANVLHSGIGFESVGLACAHDVGNFLSNFHECHEKGLMHGDKVAFGILTQLCLDEETDLDIKETVVDFLIDVGLPVTLAELGLDALPRERLEAIGEFCAGEGSLTSNHRFPVTPESIVDALFSADAYGAERLAGRS